MTLPELYTFFWCYTLCVTDLAYTIILSCPAIFALFFAIQLPTPLFLLLLCIVVGAAGMLLAGRFLSAQPGNLHRERWERIHTFAGALFFLASAGFLTLLSPRLSMGNKTPYLLAIVALFMCLALILREKRKPFSAFVLDNTAVLALFVGVAYLSLL